MILGFLAVWAGIVLARKMDYQLFAKGTGNFGHGFIPGNRTNPNQAASAAARKRFGPRLVPEVAKDIHLDIVCIYIVNENSLALTTR
ncbi:MAG: hypothetical protein ACREQR_12895 [Candidatus Binataceae bacterium]